MTQYVFNMGASSLKNLRKDFLKDIACDLKNEPLSRESIIKNTNKIAEAVKACVADKDNFFATFVKKDGIQKSVEAVIAICDFFKDLKKNDKDVENFKTIV